MAAEEVVASPVRQPVRRLGFSAECASRQRPFSTCGRSSARPMRCDLEYERVVRVPGGRPVP